MNDLSVLPTSFIACAGPMRFRNQSTNYVDAATSLRNKLQAKLTYQSGRILKRPERTEQSNESSWRGIMKRSWVFALVAIMFVLGGGSRKVAFAQGGANASISGIVQDQSKALIPGVTVTAT